MQTFEKNIESALDTMIVDFSQNLSLSLILYNVSCIIFNIVLLDNFVLTFDSFSILLSLSFKVNNCL